MTYKELTTIKGKAKLCEIRVRVISLRETISISICSLRYGMTIEMSNFRRALRFIKNYQ